VVPTALALLIVACSSEAWAGDSVQADATLAQKTVVTPVTDSGGKTTYAITAGTTRGGYLFHSFASFGLLSHEMAHFNQAASIQSIFARVPGIHASQIDGLIKANGNANLYLFNPKGIVFGPNASVNVGGAFIASTAKAVDFGSYSFSAETGKDVPELLSSDITPGLQPGASGSLLKNQGVLTVQQGKALLLSSDRIEISGGSVSSTTINGTDGGSIHLNANTITLDQGAVVVSYTSGSGRGGPITIDAGALTLTGGSGLATLTSGTGAAGVINLNTTTPRPLTIAFDNSFITTTTQVGPGGGQGGTISIGTTTAPLAITGAGLITAQTQGSGKGGQLNLQGSFIALDRVTAATEASGSGNGGTISINSGGSISLNQGAQLRSSTSSSGDGGTINTSSDQLNLSGASQLTTQASSTGAAGVINLNTTNPRPLAIAFSGNSLINATTIQPGPGGGQGGTISIGTPSASLAIAGDGRITAETQGSGNGGQLNLQGSSIALQQTTASTETSGAGRGGSIALSTGSLQLDPGTSLSSSATASGAGGAITVAPPTATPLSITGSGLIETTATGSGSAGAIRIGTNGTSAPPVASSTTLSGGVRLKTNRSSVDLSSTGSTIVQGGSIEADGGSITISGSNSTKLSGTSLTANSVNNGGVEKTGRIVVGGSLSGTPAAVTATSKSTEIGSGTSLSAAGGGIDVLSTGNTTSSGNLDASGGMIKLAGSNTTINGGLLTANQGGSISVQGGDIAVGSASGRTILLAGNGALKAGESDAKAVPNLTLLDSAVTLAAGPGRSIEIYSGSQSSPGQTILRAAGANGGNPADARAVRVSTSGTGGNVVLGRRLSATAVPVSATTIGDGVGIRANDGRLSVNTTGNLTLGSGTQLQAGGGIELWGKTVDEITTPLLAKIAGSSRWFIEQSADVNVDGYTPTADRSLTIEAAAITVDRFSLAPAAVAWQMATGPALEFLARGANGLTLQNMALSLGRSGTATSSDLFRAESSAGSTTISQGSKISASGGGIRLSGSNSVAIADAELKADQGGSISVQGGDIAVGSASGRTILLAGSGALQAGEPDETTAPNLTLLDGGTGSVAAISLTGGANKTVQIFSGAAAPATAQGITNVRGATAVTATAPAVQTANPAHRIVVGGNLSGSPAAATATSKSTEIGSGTSLSAAGGGIDVLSTGSTTSSGSLEAAGGMIKLAGSSTKITGGSLTANQGGSISVQGGDIEVGSASGRTILLAGSGALQAGESAPLAPNLTLLDGGTGSAAAINLTGGANKTIQIFSGAAAPATAQGITNVRGATVVTINNHIVVGGILTKSSDSPTATTSSSTTLGNGTFLKTQDSGTIYLLGQKTTSNAVLNSERIVTATDSLMIDNYYLGRIANNNKIDLVFSTSTSLAFRGKIDVANIQNRSFSAESKTISFDNFELTQDDKIWSPGQQRFAFSLRSTKVDTESDKDPGISFSNSIINLDGNGDNISGIIKLTALGSTVLIKNSTISAKGINTNPINPESVSGGGNISLSANAINIDGSIITTETENTSNGGDINLSANSIKLNNGAKLTVEASGGGKAGNISINDKANTSTEIGFGYHTLPINDNGKSLINAKTTAGGNGGNITIGTTNKALTIAGLGIITAETKGSGQGGDINLSGSIIAIKDGAEVTAKTTDSGPGGVIRVDADSLNLTGGSQLTTKATTTSTSYAGDINLNASKPRDLTITFSGKDAAGNDSKINAQTASTAIGENGRGGKINIGTSNRQLTIQGDNTDPIPTTRITAQTIGVGNGGNISLFGSDITISNKAQITAETSNAGSGGTVNVDAKSLNLTGGSQLNTQAYSSGNAGQIFLNSPNPDQPSSTFSHRDLALSFSDQSTINASTSYTGMLEPSKLDQQAQGGSIFLGSMGQSLTIRGAGIITAETKGTGSGGNLQLKGSSITLDNGINATGKTGGSGKGGDISVIANNIQLDGGSQIDAKAERTIVDTQIKDSSDNPYIIKANSGITGGAGNITLQANKITLSGKASVTAETQTTGIGGFISVDTSKLNLTGGSQLTTQAYSSGNAGKIFLNSPNPDQPSSTFSPRNLDITFSGPATINAQTEASGRGGSIFLGSTGKTLTIRGSGTITAETKGSGHGGDINLSGSIIAIKDGAEVTAKTTASGPGGVIRVDADSLNLPGGSQLTTQADSSGNAGKIFLNSPNPDQPSSTFSPRDLALSFSDQSTINASTSYRGMLDPTKPDQQAQGGSIFLGSMGKTLTISGSGTITAQTEGSGNGGQLNLQGSSIALDQTTATTETSGSGNGGTISINSGGSLSLNQGAQLRSSTSSAGHGGLLELLANTINLDGGSIATAQTSGTGRGGTINASSDRLNLSGASQLTTQASSTGNAGKIFLNSPNPDQPSSTFSPRELAISFSDQSKINASTLYSEVLEPSKPDQLAQGGSIFLGSAGQSLTISGNGSITAETQGSGKGGRLDFTGSSITLGQGAIATTQTSGTGEGGKISLIASDSISLSNGSRLDAKAEKTIDDKTLKDSAGNSYIIKANQGITGRAGDVSLQANETTLSGNASVTAETQTTGVGGSISVDTKKLNLTGASQLTTQASSTGAAGVINLNTTTPRPLAIAFSGDSLINATTTQVGLGGGLGGTISIGTPSASLAITGAGRITAETEGSGNGGQLNLQGSSIALDQATASTETSGSGNGGSISINSGSSLSLNQGARLSAITQGSGRGGLIRLQANTVLLDGGAEISSRSDQAVGSGPTGPAGSIAIDAAGPNSVHLLGGSRITSTTSSSQPFRSAADLANIQIRTPRLSMAGGSLISAASTGPARGGTISISADQARLADGSKIVVQGSGSGQAGTINLTLSRGLTLQNGSAINASTASRDGGGGANIHLRIGTDLLINNGSKIRAEAKGKANGGNIFIDIPNGFLLAGFPDSFTGSDIFATADEGQGGLIQLRTLGMFGLNRNTFDKPISEVSTRSRSGRDGVLAFFIPYLTPELEPVPIAKPLDPDNVLVRACTPRSDGAPSFTLSGPGGLPELPGGRPGSAPLREDLGQPQLSGPASSASPRVVPATATATATASADPLPGPLVSRLPLPPCP
jgi:filamentous hemagglutinin family protein